MAWNSSLRLLILVTCVQACDAPKGDPDSEAEEPSGDDDGDGYTDDDCDDMDPSVNPGAVESCDGIDNNCDGLLDDVDSVPPNQLSTFYLDSDGDGFGDSSQPIQGCSAPASYSDRSGDCAPDNAEVSPGLVEACGDGLDNDCSGMADDIDADGDGFGPEGCDETPDCNDSDASIYPGADDAWYDGVDADCAGNDDFDADGDGVAGTVGGGTDCNDSDAAVSPEVDEVCGNGVDDNCSGDADDCVPSGDLDIADFPTRIQGATSRDYMGISMGMGDAGGDGIIDVLAGARDSDLPARDAGAVYLFAGPVSGALSPSDAQAVITGEQEYDYIGQSVGLADLDNDGFADVFIDVMTDDTAAINAGAVAIFYGPISGSHTHSQADVLVMGEVASTSLGATNTSLGDIDGDGSADLAIAEAYTDPTRGDRIGRISILSGALSDSASVSSVAKVQILGEADGGGIHAEPAGDLDGDGVADLMVGVPRSDTSGVASGAVLLFRGPFGAQVDSTDADHRFVDTVGGVELGAALSGGPDADGDGLSDIAVGSSYFGDRSGRAFVCNAPLSLSSSIEDCQTRIDASAEDEYMGYDVLLVDVGGGRADLFVGAFGAASTHGEAYSFRVVSAGVFDRTDADLVVTGSSPADGLGVLLTAAGDVDNDGAEDVWLSAIHAEPSVVTLLPGGWL